MDRTVDRFVRIAKVVRQWLERQPTTPIDLTPGAKLVNDRNAAILWARSIIDRPKDIYILDTETTGLDNPEILELAIIDLGGNEVINQRFCPTGEISKGAIAIHGLTKEILQDEHYFDSIIDCLQEFIFKREILIYNASFDLSALYHSFKLWDRDFKHPQNDCVMGWYSQFCGEWNDYRGSYRWQKLPGGDHSAIGDCRATLKVIKGMAASPLQGHLQPIESEAEAELYSRRLKNGLLKKTEN